MLIVPFAQFNILHEWRDRFVGFGIRPLFPVAFTFLLFQQVWLYVFLYHVETDVNEEFS